MNANEYTDKIVEILKKTLVDNSLTIWDVFCDDKDFRKCNFGDSHIELVNSVYLIDIQKMNQEDVIELWKSTEDGCIHEISYFGDTPEYDGDMISDIRDEILPLIALDIDSFYEKQKS